MIIFFFEITKQVVMNITKTKLECVAILESTLFDMHIGLFM